MKFIKLLVTFIFAFTSSSVYAVEGATMSAKDTKAYHGMMVTVAGQLNKAGTVKGLIKGLKKQMAPEYAAKLSELMAEFGYNGNAQLPHCAVKGLTILCGNESVEIIGANTVKINGKHKYTYSPDKDALAVAKEIHELVKTKEKNASFLLQLLLPPAHAQNELMWGLGGLAGGLLLGYLFFGKKKDDQPASVTNNYTTINKNYYGPGPMPPVAYPTGVINDARKLAPEKTTGVVK